MVLNSEILVVAIVSLIVFQIVVPLAMLFVYGLFAGLRSLFRAFTSGKLKYMPYAGRSYSLIESEADADCFSAENSRRVIFLRRSVQAEMNCQ